MQNITIVQFKLTEFWYNYKLSIKQRNNSCNKYISLQITQQNKNNNNINTRTKIKTHLRH